MDCQTIAETLTRRIRPQTHPLGVKLITDPDQLPQKVIRPQKFNQRIALCQWTTLARRWGKTAGAMAEEINCTPCLAGFGFKQVTDPAVLIDFFMEMGYFESPDLAEKLVSQMNFIPPAAVHGVLYFPLEQAPVEPDLALIYGTPAQMYRLAGGYIHSFGEMIRSTTGFGLSCVSAVWPHWSGEPSFVHPGRGERILAGTEEQEMLFTVPADRLEGLADGLDKTHQKGSRYPVQSYLMYQPPLLGPMEKLGQKLS